MQAVYDVDGMIEDHEKKYQKVKKGGDGSELKISGIDLEEADNDHDDDDEGTEMEIPQRKQFGTVENTGSKS